MENLLPNELEELTLCNCCHLTFNDSDALPKLFSCRHYFCLKCVSTILLKGKELYCMHCWKRTELLQPDMKPENLPTYNAILYLSQNMMNIKTKNMINSTGDKNQYSSTNNNINNNNINNNNNNNNKIRLNENCLTHAMPNSLWCLKCNNLVCRACASTEEHRNHTVKSLNEAKESIHNDILSDLMKMQKKLSDLQHLVFKQRDFLLKILEGCTTLKTQIETELINHIPTLEISDIRGNLSKAKVTLTLLEHQQSPAEAHKLLTSLHIEKQRLQSKYNEMLMQCKLEELIQQYGSLLDFELLKHMSSTLTNGNIETLNLNNNSINNNNTMTLNTKSTCESMKSLTINNIINNNNNNNNTTNSIVNCNNRVVINSGHNNMILLLANYCISQLYTHHIQTTKTINQLTSSQQLHTTNNNINNINNNNNNILCNTGIGGIASMPEQYQLAIPESLHKYPDMAVSPSNSFMQSNDLFGIINNNGGSGFQTGNGGFNQQQQQQQQQHHPTPPPNSVPFISDLNLNGMPIAIMQHHHHHMQHSNIHHIQQSVSNTNASIATTIISPSITASSTANKPANTIVQNPTVHVYPIYYFNIEINGNPFGRILIEVRNDVAPKMAKNFGALCTRELGFGYKGCNIFQCWENESIITGDFELNNGRGGRSVFEDSFFMPDDTKILAIRGSVGMRRSQKRHDNMGLVGSQFRIILREMRGFTGIFAFVVEGLDLVDKISKAGDSAGKPQSNVIIVNCGKWQ